MSYTRRQFLESASALGAASLLGYSRTAVAESPPETRRIRFVDSPSICGAPMYLAEELLRLEGFSQIEYFQRPVGMTRTTALSERKSDIDVEDAQMVVAGIDRGHDVIALGGVHAGCYELFAHEDIETIRDLKGRTIVILGFGRADHVFLSVLAAYIGMDPSKDFKWLTAGTLKNALRIFKDRGADAFLAFPPHPQQLRAEKIGRVILDTTRDRPWSQYFCCILIGNREFVAKHPIATKRAMRAILKAADICSQDPQRVAHFLVAKGHVPKYEIALEVLQSIPYRFWREQDPEDSLRFHALRLREVGMIKSSPQKIIAQGTDWRTFNELKKELKA